MERPSEITGNNNAELKISLSNHLRQMFWQTLSLLEVAFPHEKGDGSENEKKFNTLRSKVLRVGNDAVRELDEIFDSYVAFRMFEYERKQTANIDTVIIDFKSKWLVNKPGQEETQNGKRS